MVSAVAVVVTPFRSHHILLAPQLVEHSNRFSRLKRAVIKTHFKVRLRWLATLPHVKPQITKILEVPFTTRHMVEAHLMPEFPEIETVEQTDMVGANELIFKSLASHKRVRVEELLDLVLYYYNSN